MSRPVLIALAIAVTLLAAPAAEAACPPQPTKQAFAEFLDPLSYTLAPGGAFEGNTTGWTLSGAKVVKENEPFYLNQARDVRSLALGSGAVATSPPMCVTLAHPVVRFVARSTGSPLGILAVSAVVRDGGGGLLDIVPMGVVTGLGSSWQPTLPMVLADGLAESLLDGSATVSFRFTVTGLGGAFSVDDVFVDPYRRG